MAGEATSKRADPRQTGVELFDLLRRYVVQETVDPVKAAAKTLVFGAAGAILVGLGLALLLLAVLRVLQIETGSAFAGTWSFAPYLITAVVGIAVVGLYGLVTLRAGRSQRTDAARYTVSPDGQAVLPEKPDKTEGP